ncbi:hypothetical protein B4U80_06616 [Leptotrombidium deliense]|uniref:Uncharacterized protein n=1 Tax=Leptotrombidium deliense TaxID=299467 RepID=A0A443RSU8_9ACAR|nr:hypothetical protein B4U80_06616 [Leptotrombidium deliense]
MDLYTYRKYIAERMVDSTVKRKRGRPKTPKAEVNAERKLDRRRHNVNKVNRYDNYDHWPVFVTQKNASRCANGCGNKSRVKCEKCNVFLCLNGARNCFKPFHVNKE